jgi:hypothetical protein
LKKLVCIVIGIVVLVVVASWLRRALAPETTKIRWLVEGMAGSFNACRAGGTVKGLSDDFEEETSRARKAEIHEFLGIVFLKERDEKTKEFRYRVELEAPTIELVPTGESEGAEAREARISVTARFLRKKGDAWAPIWVAAIDARLRKEESGWRIHRAVHETREGRSPF